MRVACKYATIQRYCEASRLHVLHIRTHPKKGYASCCVSHFHGVIQSMPEQEARLGVPYYYRKQSIHEKTCLVSLDSVKIRTPSITMNQR